MPRFGLFVIGDELLSGKRQDRHFPRVIDLLAARGLALGWAQFLGDDESRIASAIAASRREGDIVLSCGGIGATPDDLTRQAAARAFDAPLERHAEAASLIEQEYGERATPNRLLMADLPRGARLIPNPVNRVAGFSMDDHHFVPGFPDMAWPMLEWVLDTCYRGLHDAAPPVEFSLRVRGTAAESELLDVMNEVLRQHPEVRLSSLPFRGDAERPRHIELAVKARHAHASAAYASLKELLENCEGVQIEQLKTP